MLKLTEKQREKKDEGLEILRKYGWVYLNLDTRTGKTPVSLFIAQEIKAKKVLFLTKKNAIAGVKQARKEFGITVDTLVTNHEQAHKQSLNHDLIIIDEAHCMGSYPQPGKNRKNVYKLARGKLVIFLSATFSPETYSTLFHQLTIPDTGLWRNFKDFYAWCRAGYVDVKKKCFTSQDLINDSIKFNDYSEADQECIAKEIHPYIVELTQEQAGIKIPTEERFIKVQMSKYTDYLFRFLLKNRVIIGESDGNSYPFRFANDCDLQVWCDTAAKLKSKLHQIVSGTVITQSREYITLDYSKVYAIQKSITEEKFEKVVIFYKYKSELIMLYELFPNLTENAEEFQEMSSGIFAGQFLSKREGIRLDSAEALYFFNIDYAYLSYKQTKDRLVSYTRKKPIYLYWVFSDTGLEEDVYKTVLKKKDYNMYYFRKRFL